MNEIVIGALGALGSILFFGSYAVFIRIPSVMAINVDPIVFQTYKSFACFATSWLVLLYAPLKFTWWGMVGAGLWVITGVGAITAVQLAGIGPTQSLWSALSKRYIWSLQKGFLWMSETFGIDSGSLFQVAQHLKVLLIAVFISYIWGAYVFKEPIRNQVLAFLALVIMAAGMMGITWAMSGEGSPVGQFRKSWNTLVRLSTAFKSHGTFQGVAEEEHESKSLIDTEGNLPKSIQEGRKAKLDAEERFFKGIICAVIVGITNGSFMIPLQYANKDVVGVEYIISFGVGGITITLCVLAIHSAILVSSGKPLPLFHFSIAAGPALLTGLFWSAGNYCSIYATMYLGMSLGWPLVQCQLIISALWAVFYYKEVTDRKLVAGLLGSSLLVVLGAAILSKFGTTKS